MIDQVTSAEICRVCGAPIEDHASLDRLCRNCAEPKAAQDSYGSQWADEPARGVESVPMSPDELPPDPDNPTWGPMSGISVWMLSVAAIIVIPVVAVLVWYLIQYVRGTPLPGGTDELIEWLKSPDLLLVQVLSTIVAHAITVGICWAVVTRLGKRPFLAGLGWHWAGHSMWYWVVFSACILLGLLLITQLLARVIPQSEENAFADLLKSSRAVRIAIAALATFSAPFVEEVVYRGVVFSALRRHLGLVVTVVIVTVMFSGVHVLQYWGAWLSIVGLTLLSLALTVVRARTRSVLPCVMIHTLNNAFFAVLILLNKT